MPIHIVKLWFKNVYYEGDSMYVWFLTVRNVEMFESVAVFGVHGEKHTGVVVDEAYVYTLPKDLGRFMIT